MRPKTQGKRIRTLAALITASENGQAVTVPTYRGFVKPKPATVLEELPAWLVHYMLSQGMYIYKKLGVKDGGA